MSDEELVKRPNHALRLISNLQREYDKRGDRIEALTAERDEWKARSREVLTAGLEIKAKLEKVVEALRFYATQDVTFPGIGTVTFAGSDDNGRKARATLAEIEGEQT
jgi:hypothetical protein